MPDPLKILMALAGATFAAAFVFLILGRRRQATSNSWAFPAATTLGVAAGFYTGAWLLGLKPSWPPSGAQDRFLVILLPIVLGVELFAGECPAHWRLIALLRLGGRGFCKGRPSISCTTLRFTLPSWTVQALGYGQRSKWPRTILIGVGNGSISEFGSPLHVWQIGSPAGRRPWFWP